MLLVLGHALPSALTVDELQAVVAHELSHVAGGHGRFAIWVYGLRTRWMKLLDTLSEEAQADRVR